MIGTGIKGLDDVLTGLRTGDNVVWQIDDIDDYIELTRLFVAQSLADNKKVIYLRFAAHQEIIAPSPRIKRYDLDAYAGFESFATTVHSIITNEGEGAHYVFDCLSGLLSAWATDLMISNFFMVTCPYLYELKTIAYFSILRNSHSFKSIVNIRETTQLLIDVYHGEGTFYVHPLKVWNRYTPTMFLPHQREEEKFVPITDSVNTVTILSYMRERGAQAAKRNLDYWDRLFLEAEGMVKESASPKDQADMVVKLSNIMMTKNEKILSLVTKTFSLEELIEIKSKLVGTGFVGGKTVGMLLARKILEGSTELDWKHISEDHDSFYIGSDIFYSYLVQNRWWKLHLKQKTDDGYFAVAHELKEKMLTGTFPESVIEQFRQMIEYFGASPIIVRSSSLLEDGYGNAFAGKYESVFLANQGTPEERCAQFIEAVKTVYASTLDENALIYRKQRGLDKLDEQMALLVQRVSGSHRNHYFFPDVAGVGLSFNVYVWNEQLDPKSGMLRAVFGLGTRAVNRVDGDYPRMVALDAPLRRPYAETEDLRKFSQHQVDVINTRRNILDTIPFEALIAEKIEIELDRVAIRDDEAASLMKARNASPKEYWILTLDSLFSAPAIVDAFKKILQVLERIYQYPVEIEFTLNFIKDGGFRINLLQCRPFQTRGLGKKDALPKHTAPEHTLLESKGYFLGGNISLPIKQIVYVDPQRYSDLVLNDKYEAARIIGQVNRAISSKEVLPTLLMGPGRWGTTTPSLGVPVKFGEINNIVALAEIAFSAGNLMPELSFGTHFFQDLVETDIFYFALFPEKREVRFNLRWLNQLPNLLTDLIPEAKKYHQIIRIYDVGQHELRLMSDIVSQRVLCFSTRHQTT